ncbi:mitochondrial 39-S ribosomal protein L47 (MRP-L47)-domain-containing protein [Peziza echinospora]|nr:mitochondrial 39-S ribosomal protein L47 (MRP-L47)-domain-containing protein [Peziza echinospora]
MTSLRCLNTAQWALLPARCAKVATNLSYVPVATFHDSATLAVRTYRDANKSRGVSAIHRKYPKPPLSISKFPLPEPVLDSKTKSAVQVDQEHGLYGFFMAGKKVLPTPEEDHKHGRAWSVEELRRKNWDDLHKLWWLCVKERNIMKTQYLERQRLEPGFGEFEAGNREKEIKRTMRAIKHTLTERYYAWQEAVELAKVDPEVDLTGNGPPYTPRNEESPIAPPEDLGPSQQTEGKHAT